MSIDIDWDSLTSGPAGDALAESIRAFIHARFQTVPLPRFIRSVHVHSFDLGSVAPEIEILDVSDPLPEFYDDDDDDDSEDDDDDSDDGGHPSDDDSGKATASASEATPFSGPARPSTPPVQTSSRVSQQSIDTPDSISRMPPPPPPSSRPFHRANARDSHPHGHAHPLLAQAAAFSSLYSRASTPGIPGGTAHLGYFHLPLSAGLSAIGASTPTPLAAAAAGAPAGFADLHNLYAQAQRGASWINAPPSPPPPDDAAAAPASSDAADRARVGRATDVQVAARLRYAGDVRLSLTAEILLDYPMPSFVALPLRLAVVRVAFDGVALVAHMEGEGDDEGEAETDGQAGAAAIEAGTRQDKKGKKRQRRRVHFCFVAPEDAAALLDGRERKGDAPNGEGGRPPSEREAAAAAASDRDKDRDGGGKVGGLFEEIKVESEIGATAGGPMGGRQALKNVGKVEKFVLAQVRHVFEGEFVFPNYWTFLV